VHITWSTPDDGGAHITMYKIYRGTPGGDEVLLATVPGNVNNYDDTTVSPDLTYYYRVTAVNNTGEGPSCGLAFALVPESSCRLPGRTVVADTSDSGQNPPPDPRVDIQSISVAEPFLGAGVNKLVFTMKLAPSTMNMAPPNSQWFIIWNRINNTDPDFDRWYVAMRSDATGAVSFEYGKFGVLLQIVPPDPNPNANTPVKLGDADSGVYDPITGLLRITLSNDKFIEHYNNTSNDIIVGGADGVGWALVADGGSVVAIIPNGTGIPAHGHYLIANSDGYSLNGYAPPDQTYSGDLGDGQGLALFTTTNVADFATATPLDAVGFVGIEPPYSEGMPLASPGANDGEYSFVRKLSGTGLRKDTNDKASDFAFVSTNGGSYGGVQSTLGAPGPENSQSPVQRNAQIKASLPDPQCVASNSPTSACARVRDASDTGPNKTNGTLSFRRRFTNKTGFAITKLRFRIVDITTTGGRAMSEADLRALSSSTITVTDSNNQSVTVLGTT